jgi:uncharacterized lipoprotein YbaY
VRPILARVFSGTVWLFAGWVGFTGVMHGEEANTNDMKTIEGSVWYCERMALPPDAEIRIPGDALTK